VRVEVNKALCQLHGQCVYAAPEVFKFGEDGELHYNQDPSPTLRADVEAAVDQCPVQAIELVDSP
jgi:ferredoxin